MKVGWCLNPISSSLRRLAAAAAAASSFAPASSHAGNRNGEADPPSRRDPPGDLANHSLGRLALEPNRSWTRKGGHEQPFPSGNHVREALDHLDVCWLKKKEMQRAA
jgi:hypothetical protein